MFITPIQRISNTDLSQINNIPSSSRTPISNIFQDVLQNVIDTDKEVAMDLQSLATGESDDLHTLAINQNKAQLSIQLLVQLRNRLMESYSEIMRINL